MTTSQQEEQAFALAKELGLKLVPFWHHQRRLFFVRRGLEVIHDGRSFDIEEVLEILRDEVPK